MRFTAPAGELAAALTKAALTLDARSVIPALTMARVVASEELVAITVDVLDRRTTVTLAAAVERQGEGCADAAVLAKLLAGLPPDATVRVEKDGDAIIIRSGRSRYRVRGLPLENLPAEPAPADENVLATELDGEDLLRLIEVTQFAISTEEARYYLNGIYLHQVGDLLRVVATDGHCLAQCELPLPAGANGMPGIIVPSRTVALIAKLLKRPPPDSVALRYTSRFFELTIPGLVIRSKLVGAIYPDYQRVLPAPSTNSVTIDSEALRKALARLEAVANESAEVHSAGLTWNKEDEALRLCLSAEPGVADDAVTASECIGSGRVAANISYLRETLLALKSKSVRIDSATPASPIRVTTPDNPRLLTIVMPLAWFASATKGE
jgi:DNA polymerase-3 subunit beta